MYASSLRARRLARHSQTAERASHKGNNGPRLVRPLDSSSEHESTRFVRKAGTGIPTARGIQPSLVHIQWVWTSTYIRQRRAALVRAGARRWHETAIAGTSRARARTREEISRHMVSEQPLDAVLGEKYPAGRVVVQTFFCPGVFSSFPFHTDEKTPVLSSNQFSTRMFLKKISKFSPEPLFVEL